MRDLDGPAAIVAAGLAAPAAPPTEGSDTVPRRLTTVIATAAMASALVLTGCGEESATTPSSALSHVTVEGEDPEEAPTVEVEAPLEVTRTESEVVTEGDGATIAEDDLVSLQAILVNGTDGTVVANTWDESGAVGLDLGQADLFASFKSQIPGNTVGSRIVIVSTPEDAYGDTGNEALGITKDDPVVFVVDLQNATQVLGEAQGTAVDPKKGLPTVTMNDGEPATIEIPEGEKAPTKTVVQPLIEGDGPEVEKGQTVRVAYTGALWRNGEVFDSSANRPDQPWFEFQIGGGQVITGWDEGLLGQTVGSRVLLVIPPEDGYGDAGQGDTIKGDDTLVFVVDILAAY